MLTLGLEAKKDQWRDADWQVQALQTSKAVSQANLIYTNGLINAGPGGLINGEIQYQDLTNTALSMRGTANVIEGIGEAMRLIPDLVLGAAGFGGSPVSIAWIPLGTKLGDALEAVGADHQQLRRDRQHHRRAGSDQRLAGSAASTSGSTRRRCWPSRSSRPSGRSSAPSGAATRRCSDLNNHQRQIEQSREVQGLPPRQVHRPRAVPVPAEGDAGAATARCTTWRCTRPGRPSARSTSSAATPPGASSRTAPGTTCTRACWPASGCPPRCATWRRPTSTRTSASTS